MKQNQKETSRECQKVKVAAFFRYSIVSYYSFVAIGSICRYENCIKHDSALKMQEK